MAKPNNIPDSAISCKDVKCNDPNHREEIDNYVTALLNAVSESGKETIPANAKTNKNNNNSGNAKKTAGWKEFVEPFQDNAHFWHSVWLSAGRPVNTVLHTIMKKSKNRFHYQVRKCKRIEDYLKNNKIVENCLENDTDLFKEIKRQRSNQNDDEVTIDGAADDNIPDKFASIYKDLFNSGTDDNDVKAMKAKIDENICDVDLQDVNQINSFTVGEAMEKIKANKSDSVYDFSSDFLKQSPDILHDHLANIIKAFAIHGHVTGHLLIAILVPIVKDKLGDVCSSKNYRSIAVSSLILKLLDWILILKYGHLLKSDDLQFGFQPLSNTSLCSWFVYETIDKYLRNGSTVYGCLLDCTKAFDTVEHSKLFEKLLEAKVPRIMVRLLMVIYRQQTAKVRWKQQFSEEFEIRNGVRQGAVISPIFFCFYMDSLFTILKRNNSGCLISGYYAGCVGYADDLLFLCPSRSGLQEMLDLAQQYVSSHKISFSTDPEPKKSKTKGMVFSRKNLGFSPAPLTLNGNDLPWVDTAKYLGNTVNNIPEGFIMDCKQKRAMFIEKNCTLNQEFYIAHPEVKCKINRIYNSSFPGSVLWDLTSGNFTQLVNSWSVAVRHMWGLPSPTHRYLVEELSGEHALIMIIRRYIKFIQSIQKSPKLPAQLLLQKILRNVNTVTGKNVRFILDLTRKEDIFKIKPYEIKSTVKFCEIPAEEKWRTQFIKEIVNINQNTLTLDQHENALSIEDLQEILDHICTC